MGRGKFVEVHLCRKHLSFDTDTLLGGLAISGATH